MAIDSSGGVKTPPVQFQRPRPTAEENDKKLRDVAELYQRQFMQEMVKAMRGTVQESGLIKVGQAEKIYREQLDQNYVENWSKKGGIGLADMIYQQLVDKLGPQMGLKQKLSHPKGPIKLDQTSDFNGFVHKNPSNPQKTVIEFEKNSVNPQSEKNSMNSAQATNPVEIQSPWSGQLLGSQKIQLDEYLLDVLHDNGLRSKIVFKGSVLPELRAPDLLSPEQGPVQINEGQTLGILSPEANKFFWNIEPSVRNDLESQTLE